MNKSIIVIIVAILLTLGGLFYGNKLSQNISEVTTTANRALDLVERVEDILGSTYTIDDIIKHLETSQPLIDTLLIIIEDHSKKLDKIDKELSSIPTFEIPNIDYIHPSTYEECLGELEKLSNTAEELVIIIEHQKAHISLLVSKTEAQNMVIENQKEIIEIQALDREEIRERWEEYKQAARRERFISYGIAVIGIAIVILF